MDIPQEVQLWESVTTGTHMAEDVGRQPVLSHWNIQHSLLRA